MSVSDNSGTIEHEGIVQKSDNESVIIKILSVSSCAGCHAEGLCTLSGVGEKTVVVPGTYNVAPGDTVTVLMKKSTGYSAVLLSYLFPLILMISALIVLIESSVSELVAGLVSIGVLVPYYFILWLLRKRISNNFTFKLKV
jgi:sigma-E factor negative regulatory protein RseC